MRDLVRSPIALLLVFSFILGSPPPVAADLVTTSEALALEDESRARLTVESYLARDDVEARLVSLGVDPEMARLRVAALSAEEVVALAGRVEQEPAGGDSLLVVLGITFVVLLVLELVGVIDIFNKV